MAGAIAGESTSLQEFFEKCKKCEVVVVTEEEEKPVPVGPVAPEEETPTIKKKIPKKKKSAKTGPTGAEGFLAEIPIPVTDGTKTRKLGVERAKKILSSLGLATDPYRGEVAAMTSTASRTSST